MWRKITYIKAKTVLTTIIYIFCFIIFSQWKSLQARLITEQCSMFISINIFARQPSVQDVLILLQNNSSSARGFIICLPLFKGLTRTLMDPFRMLRLSICFYYEIQNMNVSKILATIRITESLRYFVWNNKKRSFPVVLNVIYYLFPSCDLFKKFHLRFGLKQLNSFYVR